MVAPVRMSLAQVRRLARLAEASPMLACEVKPLVDVVVPQRKNLPGMQGKPWTPLNHQVSKKEGQVGEHERAIMEFERRLKELSLPGVSLRPSPPPIRPDEERLVRQKKEVRK